MVTLDGSTSEQAIALTIEYASPSSSVVTIPSSGASDSSTCVGEAASPPSQSWSSLPSAVVSLTFTWSFRKRLRAFSTSGRNFSTTDCLNAPS